MVAKRIIPCLDIYNKYFLKPGAQIIVDFGWDTANLYDPNDIVDSDKLQKLNRGNNFDEVFIFFKLIMIRKNHFLFYI